MKKLKKTTRFALERQVQFLFEERTETYIEYVEGVPQKKIVHGGKSASEKQALPGLKERGAESGLVAIVVVTMIVIVLSLMTIGFARIMDRGLRQAIDRELATQAQYAAEAGLSDARAYIADKAKNNTLSTADTNGQCLSSINTASPPAPFLRNGSLSGHHSGSNNNLVRYTCVIIDTTPKELIYDIKQGESKVFKVITNNPLDKLFFSWENKERGSNPGTLPGLSGSKYVMPTEGNFATHPGTDDRTGILRTTVYPITDDMTVTSSSDAQNQRLQNVSRTAFLYPNSSSTAGLVQTAPSADGSIMEGNCNLANLNAIPAAMPYKQAKPRFCNAAFDNIISVPTAPVVNLNTNRTSINTGGSITLSWSVTGANTCTASAQPANANWTGAKNASSGAQTISGINTSTYFILNCRGAGGSTNDYVAVTVSPVPPTTVSRNGNAYTSCVPLETYLCANNGNSVHNYQNYVATYSLGSGTYGNYNLTLNYSDFPNGVFPVPPCGSYNFVVNVRVNGGLRINNWTLAKCGGSATANIGNVPANSTISFEWINNVFVSDGSNPFAYDPNFQIDSLTVTPTSIPPATSFPVLNLPSLPNPSLFYYVRLTALYHDLSVSVQASDISNNALEFEKAEAVIDVTGQGNDVLKRLQAVVTIDPTYDVPALSLQSMDTLCKRLRLPKTGANSYGPAVIDDPVALNVDGACKP